MARRARLEPRETRLDATGAFLGSARTLATEYADTEPPPRRIRSFSEAASDDIGEALALLGLVRDLGIVVHGPVGCASPDRTGRLAVTGLDEQDTVLGSGDALAETVRRLDAETMPAAIAVLGSPVVAINNDDIRATVAELSVELSKPVVWVRTDGFRSHIAATGADAAIDALLQLTEPEGLRDPGLLNLLTLASGPNVDTLVADIEALGWRVNPLPAGGSVASFSLAGTAAASLVLDPDRLERLAAGLEERFGVVHLDVALPIGPQATSALLRRLAAFAGKAAPLPAPSPDPAALAGRRITLALAPGWALGLADLIGDLGGEVVLLCLPHIDRSHATALQAFAERHPDAQIHVGDAQGFEMTSLLDRVCPDVLIGTPAAAVHALRLGLPAAVAGPEHLIGVEAADHVVALVRSALEGAALARRASRFSGTRYTPRWIQRSPDWHIKLEVR